MSTNFQIRKPIDVTVARNFLRKRTTGAEWTPTCRARAAAALTIFAEFVLSSRAQGVINVSILNRQDLIGVELKSTLKAPGDYSAYLMEMGELLKRVTDESEISIQDPFVTVSARIWTTGKVIDHG